MLPNIADMTAISVDQLLADFDAILDRVEAGECFHITEVAKPALVLIPYNAAIG